MKISFAPETLFLENRSGRMVPVSLNVFLHGQRCYVVLRASEGLPTRQLSKSAEHLAYQLVARFQLEPECVEFYQYHSGASAGNAAENSAEWLRWRFHWVGGTPIQGRCEPVSDGFLERVLKPVFQQGHKLNLQPKVEADVA